MELNFTYKNHRGITAPRRVRPTSLLFIPNPGFGYAPGWFLNGVCLDKLQVRSFALSNIALPDDGSPLTLIGKFPR